MKLVILAVLVLVVVADAKIIAAVVIPHGDFAFDPSLVNYENGSRELHDTSVEVGKLVGAMNPVLFFLSTPHGMNLNRDFIMWGNSNASGFAMLGDDLHNSSFPSYKVEMKVPVARDVALQMQAALSKLNVSTVGGFADTYPELPIGWGEVIPLQFVKDRLDKKLSRTLLWGQPARRSSGVTRMIPELLQVGGALFDFLHQIPQRVAFMISSDLAHTHRADGPYGFSPTAVPFDNACGAWASTMQGKPLLEDAARIVDQALSCGYSGLVMLHGLLTRATETGQVAWQSKLYSNFHPTYYGMMVATFLPK